MSMWRSRISIRITLFLFIGLLNLIIGLLVGVNVYTSWISYNKVQAMRQNLIVTNLLYQSEKFLSLERGIAASILFVSGDMAGQMRSGLTEARRAGDELLQTALQQMGETFGGGGHLPAAVAARLASLNALREKLDAALAQPKGEYEAEEITKAYYGAITGMAEEIGSLAETLTIPVMRIDPEVSQQMLFNHIIWKITENAGQEYAEIGWLIASNRLPSSEMLQKFDVRRGHTEHGWERARFLVTSSELNDSLNPLLEKAKNRYFSTFEQTRNFFYGADASSYNGSYPISIEAWLDIATQAVEPLFAMKDAALTKSQAYVRAMVRGARSNAVTSLFMLLLALILSVYSWKIITIRVIRPVNGMVDALYRAIHGEPYQLPSITHRYDEIGKLARILEIFQLKTKEWEDHKNYLRTVLGTMMDAVLTIAEDGTIQLLNPSAEKIFGYKMNEILGKDISLILPDSFAVKFKDHLRVFLDTGSNEFLGNFFEFEAKNKDGLIFPIELSVTETTEAGHRIFVLVVRDITQRKAQEEVINRYLFDLERSNQELDDFAYIASHDLKEPLRGLHNFSRFLIEDYEDKLDQEGKNMLQTIADLTQRMEDQLNALLHYSRLGRTELSIKVTDLNDLLESVVRMFAITLKERNARIEIVRPLPTIVCDYVRIRDVFQNLISNALKYNDSVHPYVEIGYREDHPRFPGRMVFYVRDNGIGIEEKNLESIFKIFRRLHPRSAYGGGTGSGLSIVKKIINQHDGTIWVESDGPGQGCVFYFTLPSQEKDSVQAA